MTTNNSVNLQSSGIVSYDGSGTFSALANPLTVSNGGSGASSETAYAVLCGGTISTNPIQSIASVGTAGQILTSNGAGALPTFKDPVGYSMMSWGTSFNLADSSTYYWAAGFNLGTVVDGLASEYFIVPKNGTIVAAYGAFTVGGTLGSNENVTTKLRINATTDVNISTTIQLTATNVPFSNGSLSQAVSAGDFIQVITVTPAFSTNPTQVRGSISVFIN